MAPRPRFARIEPDRRERLLAAAAEEFGKRGYDGASVNRIIEAAGLSKGSLYYHFEDKADLFATVLEIATDEAFARVELRLDELTRENFWSTLAALKAQGVAFVQQRPSILELFQTWYHLPDASRRHPAIAAWYTRMRDTTAGWLVRGQELGVVRSDLPAPLLLELLFALRAVFDRWLMAHPGDLDLQELARKAVDLTERVTRPGEAS